MATKISYAQALKSPPPSLMEASSSGSGMVKLVPGKKKNKASKRQSSSPVQREINSRKEKRSNRDAAVRQHSSPQRPGHGSGNLPKPGGGRKNTSRSTSSASSAKYDGLAHTSESRKSKGSGNLTPSATSAGGLGKTSRCHYVVMTRSETKIQAPLNCRYQEVLAKAVRLTIKTISTGQRLCKADDQHTGGRGTYTRNGYVYSCLAGHLHTTKSADDKVQVEVVKDMEQNTVPAVDSIVTARVTNVNPRFCKCGILSVGRIPLREPFRGQIRREDVRATEKDKIEMYKCFRPGDIVVARVISLGDSQSYLLTTAENELGVVMATSEAGAEMVPVSWCKMKCPKTFTEEFRKVAKVQKDFLQYTGTS